MDPQRIRNFSIIAHIDHGKTTLSDRLLHRTGTVATRDMEDQLLDAMDLERERGITIKAHPVTMLYTAKNGEVFELNLIDTPGHVDFAYEVSRSLSACEGALLIVDAAQGVEAQTVANVHLAMKQNLEIIPVINKIDLPHANIPMAKQQLEDILAIPGDSAIQASAKEGIGIEDILEAIVHRMPAPKPSGVPSLQALIFDSFFDTYKGVVILVRVTNGELKAGTQVKLLHSGKTVEVKEVGSFNPKPYTRDKLTVGETGYFTANIKTPREVKVGDTITDPRQPAPELPGFQEIHPMVFSGIYPINTADYESLKVSIAKLQLNDSALTFQTESSAALGFGLRCGFLGLLHMEIVQERLEREFNLDLVTTAPSVVYKVKMTDGSEIELHNPADYPDPMKIASMQEPWIKATIITPDEHLGSVLTLCQERRGQQLELTYAGTRAMAIYKLPLNEVVFDFYDRLKSVTRGYASFDYEMVGYEESELVKLSILVNSEPVDALSMIVHKAAAESRGRALCERLKDLIPRQLFKIAIQAAIGGRVIARETISALRKDVLAKCYGGDISRKKKLLEKQKKGKKRMRQVGDVEIPQSAFIAALKMDSR